MYIYDPKIIENDKYVQMIEKCIKNPSKNCFLLLKTNKKTVL